MKIYSSNIYFLLFCNVCFILLGCSNKTKDSISGNYYIKSENFYQELYIDSSFFYPYSRIGFLMPSHYEIIDDSTINFYSYYKPEQFEESIFFKLEDNKVLIVKYNDSTVFYYHRLNNTQSNLSDFFNDKISIDQYDISFNKRLSEQIKP